MSEDFNLPKAEEKTLEFWKTNGIFEKTLKKTAKGKPFTFYDGPPFATGLPHYGHILASTIKDVIPRYQTMRGRFVRRRWGWDCHGLPIEEVVERKLGISGKKQIEEIGIKKFNETCRSMVLEYANEWKRMVERIARWVEFDDSYKTMDTDYMESVWWAFKEIYKKGLIYEGRKVLLYCPRCETPLSNFEVALDQSYKDVTEEAVTVKFKLTEPNAKRLALSDKPVFMLAWTTTPWTLVGNVALAVGEDFDYVVARKNEEYVIVAKNLARILGDGTEIIREIKGRELIGLAYDPLFNVPALQSDKAFHVYPADFVNTDEGTGIVHTAVVYGEDDYNLGVKVGLPIVPLLDEKGKFNEQAPEFIRGMYFKDAEKFIKKDLEDRKLLLSRKMYQHSYPYCWRCGNVLFYNAIPAWFVNIQKIKPKLLKSNAKEINWFPEHLKHGRYEKSVEAAPDWNISRNRYWGNPIPVWKCAKCKREEAVGSIEELAARGGKPKNNYWVMRHGEGENNVFHIIDSGKANFKLTPSGVKSVVSSVEKLKKSGARIDVIVSSPILRTKETAELAAGTLGIKEIVFDPNLEEIHLGALQGCHSKKYKELFPTYESKFEQRPEDGESLRDLRARMWGFLEDCEKKYAGKNILLVSHEYPIWMLLHAASAWSEKKAIAEKVLRNEAKKNGDFVETAEVHKLDFKVVPRDDTGLVDLHRPYIDDITLACACGGEMRRTPEIFDSWMEAGSMPFAEYHYPFENKKVFESRFPAQFVAEYIAQTRAWFYVMHVVSLVLFGKAPFENVVTTGNVLNEKGEKLSKSKQNYTDPWITLDKYGADALRFQLMNSVVMQSDDLFWTEKEVATIYRKVNLLLWNVYNYFTTYVEEKKNDEAAPSVLDRWIKERTAELVEKVTGYLDAYDTVRATRSIQEYVDDLSTWYLRRSRKRRDGAFFDTLRDCLLTTSKVIAPFMPFLSEILYRDLKTSNESESVHLADWPKAEEKLIDHQLIEAMNEIRHIASLALAKRAEAKIKVRQPLSVLKFKSIKFVRAIAGRRELKAPLEELLKGEINVKEVLYEINQTIPDDIQLDTVITPELKEEGIVRDLTRMVQELRQKAGLKPKDRIILSVEAQEPIRGIIARNEHFLKREVGAEAIEEKRSEKFDAEESSRLEDQDIWLSVRKS